MNYLTMSDENLAEKFRREFTEQFHILVRMHLSFVLDLNTDENECFSEKSKFKRWKLVPFGKKSKSCGVMDGAPLTQEGICQVYQLIEFLKSEQNIKVEGIFRRTGSLSRQQELRNLLNQGTTLVLEDGNFSVHDCASVLKGFLAELPDPLLTEAHFPAYCQIAELCGIIDKPTQESKLLEALQLILLLLPSDNKVLLKDILDLLYLTTRFESSNRMCADNLATLFTPHLLCPRKLTPEQLHVNSQTLCGIIAFMIKHCADLFKIPPKLVVDFRARYEKQNLLLQTSKRLNESVSDQYAANTVFTFVDHERTAKENESNPTETALAQLYAYIQTLPESSKKRKLVKQFNKENGHGTPLQVLRSNMPKSKSLGDSIKKRILNKGLMRSVKKSGFSQTKSSSEEILNSPSQGIITRARLFCTNCDSSTDVSNDESLAKKIKRAAASTENVNRCSAEGEMKRSLSDSDLSLEINKNHNNLYLTSTPAYVTMHHACPDVLFTPEAQDRKSMSPITRSTQRMSRAMQETMMTPRSRKPVLLVSGTNLNNLPKMEFEMDHLEEEPSDVEENELVINLNASFKKSKSEGDIPCSSDVVQSSFSKTEARTSLTSTFREYLSSRDVFMSSPADLSFCSRTDDFNSNDLEDISEGKMSESLLYCLDGNEPDYNDVDMDEETGEKKLILKPKQFDENGQPTVFETSF